MSHWAGPIIGASLLGTLQQVIFFFSSRRRHARWDCDCSSDVCSSDLSPAAACCCCSPARLASSSSTQLPARISPRRPSRSAERRVGNDFAIATVAVVLIMETLMVNWRYLGGATGLQIRRPPVELVDTY